VQIWSLILKALIGGVFVVLFSIVAAAIRPRRLASVTSAAPSVALASLVITVLTTTAVIARSLAIGMIGGAVGLRNSMHGRSPRRLPCGSW
jgi:hypothetical protein